MYIGTSKQEHRKGILVIFSLPYVGREFSSELPAIVTWVISHDQLM